MMTFAMNLKCSVMENREWKWFYQLMLSGPGMEETVKHSFALSRSLTLLLSHILESGLKERKGDLIECYPEELIQELNELRISLLEKSNLLKLTEKLAQGK
jgi:hypothetical protein